MKTRSILLILPFFLCIHAVTAQTIVDKYGQLSVKGNYLLSERGDTVQLRGMSLFWSQWMGQFYNPSSIKWLRDDWKCTIVRAAMGVEMGGYLSNPEEEKQKVMTVVDAAIQLGIYVIIDYHSHEAHKNTDAAKKFFSDMARKYGKNPNVLYEIFNEPLKDVSWKNDLKPYSEEVIKSIRQFDPDNIVIVGTRQWSQMVSEAAEDPIADRNVVYTLHYYAGTHKQVLRDEAQKALDKGIALFVSEFGTCDASGNGNLNPEESATWFQFLDKRKISWCNWSVADKDETASALKPGANGEGGWPKYLITPSGKIVKDELLKNIPLFSPKK